MATHFAALEWHAKEGKLKPWETEGEVFERGSTAEADTLGKLFFELERSGGLNRQDLAPENEAGFSSRKSAPASVVGETK